jgi:hypothetical protein
MLEIGIKTKKSFLGENCVAGKRYEIKFFGKFSS